MGKLLWTIYVQPLGRIVFVIALLVRIWGFLGAWMGERRAWRGLNAILFLLSLSAVIYLTVSSREPGSREVILVPFQSFLEAKEEPELYRSMLMNVFLFVPMGVSLPVLLPEHWTAVRRMVLAAVFGTCVSILIEWCQYRFGLGRCEADDILMNTLGAGIGAWSAVLAKMPEKRQKTSNQNEAVR